MHHCEDAPLFVGAGTAVAEGGCSCPVVVAQQPLPCTRNSRVAARPGRSATVGEDLSCANFSTDDDDTTPSTHVSESPKKSRRILSASTPSPGISLALPPALDLLRQHEVEASMHGFKAPDLLESASPGPVVLPGIRTRRVQIAEVEEDATPINEGAASPEERGRGFMLRLATPSSCTSAVQRPPLTPNTPDPARSGFRFVDERPDVIFFDFDGTLTSTPGEAALQRGNKKNELAGRADLLRPRLAALQQDGVILGIMSKSTKQTITDALQTAGLEVFFEGPIVGRAIGFEGKAGFIADLFSAGSLPTAQSLDRVLLIDDDVRELDRAREHGIQTFAAPEKDGLQECDFDELFACLGLP